jgi:hypothetical protein
MTTDPTPTFEFITNWRDNDTTPQCFGGLAKSEQDMDDLDDRLVELKKHVLTQLEAVGFVNVVLRITPSYERG